VTRVQLGDDLNNRFVVQDLVFEGPVATLYRGADRRTGAAVALKVLRPDIDGDVGRFERECAVLAELRHPNIVRYVAHGVAAAGERYLATEWLPGEDLGRRLDRGPLEAGEVLALAQGVAAALAAMHARGIVHRDIKPANLLLPDGDVSRVRVLDLGLARRTRITRSTTRSGSLLGTPGYMAPEQVRGQRDLDARIDIFAFGAVLFEAITGVGPIRGDSVEALLGNTLLEDSPRVCDLRADADPAMNALIAQMLSRDPVRRPRDGSAVAAILAGVRSSREGRPPARGADFDELPTAPPTTRSAAALTAGERRVLSVVMLSAAAGDREFDANLGVLARAAAASGADFEVLMDGVALAILRTQGAATDQAAQAARCALALRHFAPMVPMALVTGWGEVAGRGAVGEVIDRAAKLLHHVGERPSGKLGAQISVGDVAAGLLDARFDLREHRGGVVLQGERAADGPRTLLGREAPFVGRRRELSTLLATLEECVEEPVARAVLVIAAPGMGKTRTRVELERLAQQRFSTLAAWVTRADPLRAGAPYAMVIPLLRGLFGVSPQEALPVRREKVRRRVAWHVPAAAQPRVCEFLGELIGTPFADDESVELRAARQDPVLLADQIARAWQDLVASECAARPLLLVMEDLQWGDLPSVRLVEGALRTLAQSPLLVVGTGRPETDETFPALWSEAAPQRVLLGPLTRRASDELIAAVHPDLAEDVAARISERAAGNPYFLEELLRGAAQGRGVALPGTVLAMLHARLDALEPEARRVLRAASVFGESFCADGLCALLGGAGASIPVRVALDALVARELVAPRPTSRFEGRDEFAFASTQLRDAAYTSLTEADRTLGHRLAAPWLESAGVRDAVELADHYERGGLLLRAVPWYLAAAEEALGGNDFGIALARVERGVACGASGATLGRLQVIAAELHRWRGEHAEALSAAESALDALPPGDPQWFGAVGEAAMAAARVGDSERLRGFVQRLQRAPCGDEAAPAKAEASARAAVECVATGEAEIARALVEAIPEADVHEDPRVGARALHARAMLADFDGDVVAHGWLLDEAARRYERAGDLRSMCVLRVGVGAARAAAGRFDKAEGALREARAAALRLGLAQVAALAECGLARSLGIVGRTEDARDMAQRALTAFSRQRDASMMTQAGAVAARVELLAGRLDAARDLALEATRGVGAAAPMRALALATLSSVRVARGEAAEALSSAREAVGVLRTLDGVTEDEGFILLAHAEALALVDRWDDARKAITSAWDRLQQRASRFADEESRRRFLHGIPEHARTEERYLHWAADA
jgi:tetratricopeptide (TPR) repeat protein